MPKIGWQSDLHGKMNLNIYICVGQRVNFYIKVQGSGKSDQIPDMTECMS